LPLGVRAEAIRIAEIPTFAGTVLTRFWRPVYFRRNDILGQNAEQSITYENDESDIYIGVRSVVCLRCIFEIVKRCPGSDGQTVIISNLAIKFLCCSETSG
jgi:hypothetical protein